ncbi:hypothetical protein ACOSP7_013219 [Xanthoceras sorbifolium]
MLRSWKLLRTAVKKNGVFAAPSTQQTAQHLPPTPPNNDKLKAREPDATMFKIRKPKRFRPSPLGGS